MQKLGRRFVLSALDGDALKSVNFQERSIGPRSTFVLEGEVSDYVHLIQSGFACRYKVLPDGGRSILGFLLPGDICDLTVPILGVIDHSIRALSKCTILRCSRTEINQITKQSSNIDQAFRWNGLVEEAILREWLISTRHRSAEQQIAHLFCELLLRLQNIGLADQNSYDLPLTQGDLGSATGLSVVHVNRVLQKLRADGLLIFEKRRLYIMKVNDLKIFAGFNSNYLHLQEKA